MSEQLFAKEIESESEVAQSCPTLCDPMNSSTPGLPVHHQLPEFTQTHVYRVGTCDLWIQSAVSADARTEDEITQKCLSLMMTIPLTSIENRKGF